MKKVLLFLAIICGQSLLGGGDSVLFHQDLSSPQRELTREENQRMKALAIRRAKEEERSREFSAQEILEADEWAAIEALEAQASSEMRKRDLAEQTRIEKDNAEALEIQMAMEQAEDTFCRRKHVVPKYEEESIKCPCSIVRQGLFTEKDATPIRDRLIDLISKEKKGICGAMYIFANKQVAQAIIAQVKRAGIEVQLLVDASFEKHRSKSCLLYLLENGVQVRISPSGMGKYKKIMHHKFLIFEDNASGPFFKNNESGPLVWSGSYNVSYQADKNDETVEITNDPAPIGQFKRKLVELMLTSEPIVFQRQHNGAQVYFPQINEATE